MWHRSMELAVECSNHCTIGRNDGRIRSQAQTFKERTHVGDAPAGGDGYGDAGLLRGAQRTGIPGAYRLHVAGQQRAVHVNCHQANRRMHVFSVPGAWLRAWLGESRRLGRYSDSLLGDGTNLQPMSRGAWTRDEVGLVPGLWWRHR